MILIINIYSRPSLRADETENFAPNYRRGYFPAFSAGWVVSNESFMDGVRSTLDYLKIKGSWGQLGSDRLNVSHIYYIPRYGAVSNNYAFGGHRFRD
ncbi:MAG: hypothetical protein WDN26_05100 [Chitinophagaceae bacterium]